jgi:PPM family protein phosphatase
MRLECAGLTDVGNERSQNEDGLMMRPERGVFAVFDGMGGGSSGRQASLLAEVICGVMLDEGPLLRRSGVAGLLRVCGDELLRYVAEHSYVHGLCTEAAVLWLREDGTLEVGHVGCCRVYRWRAGALTQLTEDHSLLNEYRKVKALTEQEIADFPHKHIITRALGSASHDAAAVSELEWGSGDVYVLCSDGLHDAGDALLERVLSREPVEDVARICEGMMGEALSGAAADNIAVVVVRVEA